MRARLLEYVTPIVDAEMLAVQVAVPQLEYRLNINRIDALTISSQCTETGCGLLKIMAVQTLTATATTTKLPIV